MSAPAMTAYTPPPTRYSTFSFFRFTLYFFFLPSSLSLPLYHLLLSFFCPSLAPFLLVSPSFFLLPLFYYSPSSSPLSPPPPYPLPPLPPPSPPFPSPTFFSSLSYLLFSFRLPSALTPPLPFSLSLLSSSAVIFCASAGQNHHAHVGVVLRFFQCRSQIRPVGNSGR